MAAVVLPTTINKPTSTRPASVSVIICAYTDERWDDIERGIESLYLQTRPPEQIVLVIDHNDDLLHRAANRFTSRPDMHIDVIANTLQRGLSGARNSGLAWCAGDVVAFLDDDAQAGSRDWIATMLENYSDPNVAGVGGGATPNWDGVRQPGWFPDEFGWVIGCTYTGMPTEADEVRNFIGCNMSFRREVFEQIGGFTDGIGRVGKKPVGCEETEFCIRLRQRYPLARLIFDPDLDVYHRVSADRREFRYFRSRCWSEGLSKAVVARIVGAQDGLESERNYTTRVLPKGVLRGIGDGLRGRPDGFRRAGAVVLGLVWTTAGYARGRIARSTAT